MKRSREEKGLEVVSPPSCQFTLILELDPKAKIRKFGPGNRWEISSSSAFPLVSMHTLSNLNAVSKDPKEAARKKTIRLTAWRALNEFHGAVKSPPIHHTGLKWLAENTGESIWRPEFVSQTNLLKTSLPSQWDLRGPIARTLSVARTLANHKKVTSDLAHYVKVCQQSWSQRLFSASGILIWEKSNFHVVQPDYLMYRDPSSRLSMVWPEELEEWFHHRPQWMKDVHLWLRNENRMHKLGRWLPVGGSISGDIVVCIVGYCSDKQKIQQGQLFGRFVAKAWRRRNGSYELVEWQTGDPPSSHDHVRKFPINGLSCYSLFKLIVPHIDVPSLICLIDHYSL